MNSEKRKRRQDESPDENEAKKAEVSHEAYTVGWVCALPKEQTAAIAMLDQRHPNVPNMQPPTDTNAYTLGSIGGHNIVIVCLPKGQIGVVSAATVATNMVSTFPAIKIGLLVGIGGGVPSNKVRLGDVVADCAHVNMDDISSSDEDESNSCRHCDKTKAKEKRLRDTHIHYGLVASGNQVIKDGILRDKLNKDLGGHVLYVEMEAAGLMTNFPCIVVRGICDYADSHKNKEWQEHAAAVAAACAKEILAQIEPGAIQAERSVRVVLDDSK
ncbi:nacht and ankyrin domain protein [Colletotrichum kahawae]|uniref:Nacht and ankyrin domain protein n=1 Tax=Colletotrichum kahawae TaxID=34407 RepID=A0AAE0D637_COLKA|nr:nacht and ankyrin domain protein [Colletotrichum kahawae]